MAFKALYIFIIVLIIIGIFPFVGCILETVKDESNQDGFTVFLSQPGFYTAIMMFESAAAIIAIKFVYF